MRTIRWLTALAAFALSACGGGGDACSGSFGSSSSCGTTAAVASVVVTSDALSIPSDGSVSATVTALVKDANNNAVPGVTVTFSSSGGSLVVSQGKTDATGTAKAALAATGVAAGTSITVTATTSGVSGNVAVSVVNTQRTLTLVTSLPQIPSDASKPALLTALVRDANNNVVTGAPVNFQATSGSLAILSSTTDGTGSATANLTAGNDPTNRSITVTATSGTASATVNVQVTGTTITINGPTDLIQGQVGNYTATVTNSANQGIGGATVTVTSASGNTLSAPTVTSAAGVSTFTMTASVGGADTITVTALGMSQQKAVQVSSDNFSFSSPVPTPPATSVPVILGASQAVTVNWQHNNAPFAGQTVTFAATRGTLTSSTATTDASGNATVSISSSSSGPAIVNATGTGVSAQLSLDFIANAPTQVAVQATPTTVAVGTASTISATVRDGSNNLVEGATVDFQIVTDPTNGGLQQATAVTNAQGIASVTYVAGNTSSGANGVTISATVRNTSPVVTSTTKLTVGGQAVFLSLGTGNTIDISQGPAIYQVTYSVFAVDSSGAALANVPISLEILPVAYGKGYFYGCPSGTNWLVNYTTLTTDPDAYAGQKMCKNEDTDYTGNISSLDVGAIANCTNLATSQLIPGHVKDYNCNGKLDPGNIAVVAPSTGTTNGSGRLDVTVTYPRDHAYWTEVSLIAKAVVNGTESTATSTFILLGALGDYTCTVNPPGGTLSPYGVATTCADPR